MEYVVGAKGQVVIAKGIREQLGVEPGWVAVQRLVADHVEIRFVPPPHRRSLKGVLAPYVTCSVSPGETWEDARDEAWAAAARERGGGEP
ncbi:MAG: AbrB/MazE/SpoVT family DNA-binding domain-containing protein [Deferrisomatales bacterium]|nr:AbrB/MazE/SpoVT family DNA-binding domain-containing protein [Deferrisomatales bacterium]